MQIIDWLQLKGNLFLFHINWSFIFLFLKYHTTRSKSLHSLVVIFICIPFFHLINHEILFLLAVLSVSLVSGWHKIERNLNKTRTSHPLYKIHFILFLLCTYVLEFMKGVCSLTYSYLSAPASSSLLRNRLPTIKLGNNVRGPSSRTPTHGLGPFFVNFFTQTLVSSHAHLKELTPWPCPQMRLSSPSLEPAPPFFCLRCEGFI